MADRRIIVYSTNSLGAETDTLGDADAGRRLIVYQTTSLAPQGEGADLDAGRRIIVYQAAPEETPSEGATWERRIILYGDEEQDTASASADGWIL